MSDELLDDSGFEQTSLPHIRFSANSVYTDELQFHQFTSIFRFINPSLRFHIMPTRSWIALLLLINYLLVVGIGCVSRSEDASGFLMVQTSQSDHDYQECRYLRMDGLENFLAEAMASRYKDAPETPKHHIITVVSGVDAHYLTAATWLLPSATPFRVTVQSTGYQPPVTAEVSSPVNAPPWS